MPAPMGVDDTPIRPANRFSGRPHRGGLTAASHREYSASSPCALGRCDAPRLPRSRKAGSALPAKAHRPGQHAMPRAAAGYAINGARSADARAQAARASSSNSSASFFITVPPNSSASTIVTARR